MTDDILLNLQRDLTAYVQTLLTSSQLNAASDVMVFASRTEGTTNAGVINDQVSDALAGIAQKNGKSGVAVIIMMPDVNRENLDLPGPVVRLECVVRIVENRLINEGPTGTGLSAPRLAIFILQGLHHWVPDGSHCLTPSVRAIDDITTPDIDGHEVSMTLLYPLQPIPRVATPVLSTDPATPGVLTITTATADAQIWTTTNGSLPTPTTGTLYTAPLTIIASIPRLRVLATKSGHSPSTVVETSVTIAP